EVVVLATEKREDSISKRIRAAVDRFIEVPHDIGRALDLISEQELDVLHFPDIGMDPFTYGLAHSRLAPVQTSTWGHPVTSGLPTVDYFLSSQHAEPTDAEEHYTERLVRLSRLNVCLPQPERAAQRRTRSDLRLPSDAHI